MKRSKTIAIVFILIIGYLGGNKVIKILKQDGFSLYLILGIFAVTVLIFLIGAFLKGGIENMKKKKQEKEQNKIKEK